jgi:hypothetical protein
VLRSAFRDLHGRRLHGFALLLTLGDRPTAARAAGLALADGARRARQLRHPERAAAWLRAHVLRSVHALQAAAGPRHAATSEGHAVLEAMGAHDALVDGLASLSLDSRAALIGAAIERFELLDVETILGATAPSTRRIVTQARESYLDAVIQSRTTDRPIAEPVGDVAMRVEAVASRALGRAGADPDP